MRFRVEGDSMLPALTSGEVVVCTRPGRPLRRGDLAVFPHPLRPDLTLVKRVVATGGETVTIEMGEVLIDGEPGMDTWGAGFTFPDGVWLVGEGEVFVLSDNRRATRDDSRHFGPIPVDRARKVSRKLRIGA
jgi:signal peptidase I